MNSNIYTVSNDCSESEKSGKYGNWTERSSNFGIVAELHMLALKMCHDKGNTEKVWPLLIRPTTAAESLPQQTYMTCRASEPLPAHLHAMHNGVHMLFHAVLPV